jgi:hypothetical protein
LPKAEFIHELGSSSLDRRWLGVIRYNRGKELYFHLHYGAWYAFWCLIFDRAGALLRLVGWSVLSLWRPTARPKVNLFWKVLVGRIGK